MNYLCRIIPVLILVFCICGYGWAQVIHIPANVMNRLEQQCTICNQQPQQAGLLIAADSNDLAVCYHNCVVALKKDYPDEAYRHCLYAIAAMGGSHATGLQQYIYYIKAKVLYYKRIYNGAIQEYLDLLRRFANDSILISNIYANIGEIYLEQSKFADALAYFDKWQQLFFPTAGYVSIKAYYLNKALCLFHMQKYPQAETIFFNALAINRQHTDTLGLAITCMNLGNLYYDQYKDDKAIYYFGQALQFAKRSGDIKVLKDALLNMAVVDENRNRHRSALAYRKQYEALQDSLWNRDNVWQLASQERKFAIQLNDHKMKLLEQEAQLHNDELIAKKRERNTLYVAVIGVLLFAGVVFYAYREKSKTNVIIQRQKEELRLLNQTKDRLFSIVAHDLRSQVYSLKTNAAEIQTAIAEQQFNRVQIIGGHIQKAVNSTYNLLDNMLHWALNEAKQLFFRAEKLHLLSIINQVCYDFMPLAGSKDIGLTINIPAAVFLTADGNSLKIILRNLLDNAIKYTQPTGGIIISAYATPKCCSIQIADNGIGMDNAIVEALFTNNPERIQQDTQHRQSTGFGLGLCKILVEKNNGTLEIQSEKGKGTNVHLCFKTTE
ncbi:MAG TPA: ATP-binding protein [Niastella sp.]